MPTKSFSLTCNATRGLLRLFSKTDWPRGGLITDSSSVLLGTHCDLTGPRLTNDIFRHGELIREINKTLTRTLKGHPFRWSSLRIEVNSVNLLRSLSFASGPVVSFAYG